jgi:hypothetical protein
MKYRVITPSMLDQKEEQVLSSIEETPDAQAKLAVDTFLQKRSRTTR